MAEEKRLIPVARFEATDVGRGFIWGAVATCSAVLLACALLVFWLYPSSTQDHTLALPLPVYPAPRLQSHPVADMRAFRAGELERLNSTGWVDKTEGIVHIPITQAMQEIVQEGIPGWPAAAPATSATNPSGAP